MNAEHRFWASWLNIWSALVCETVWCVAGRRGGFGMSVCYWGGKGMPRGSVTWPSCRFLTSCASQRLVVESSFSTWANVVSFSWSGKHWRRASLALRDTTYDFWSSSMIELKWFSNTNRIRIFAKLSQSRENMCEKNTWSCQKVVNNSAQHASAGEPRAPLTTEEPSSPARPKTLRNTYK